MTMQVGGHTARSRIWQEIIRSKSKNTQTNEQRRAKRTERESKNNERPKKMRKPIAEMVLIM